MTRRIHEGEADPGIETYPGSETDLGSKTDPGSEQFDSQRQYSCLPKGIPKNVNDDNDSSSIALTCANYHSVIRIFTSKLSIPMSRINTISSR